YTPLFRSRPRTNGDHCPYSRGSFRPATGEPRPCPLDFLPPRNLSPAVDLTARRASRAVCLGIDHGKTLVRLSQDRSASRYRRCNRDRHSAAHSLTHRARTLPRVRRDARVAGARRQAGPGGVVRHVLIRLSWTPPRRTEPVPSARVLDPARQRGWGLLSCRYLSAFSSLSSSSFWCSISSTCCRSTAARGRLCASSSSSSVSCRC